MKNTRFVPAIFLIVVANWGLACLTEAIEPTQDLKITLKKATHYPGEMVEYTLEKKVNGQLPMRACKRRIVQGEGSSKTVVREFGGGDWNSKALAINQGKKLKFEWNQKDKNGRLVAPGLYRVEVTNDVDFLAASQFSIASTSEGYITLKADRKKYNAGDIVEFSLENRGPTAISLDGSSFVIYKLFPPGLNREPMEFFTKASPNFLRGTLETKQYTKWKWDQWDNEHQTKASAGSHQIRVYLPGARGKSYQAEFRIEKR